jgi:hypothetical protein
MAGRIIPMATPNALFAVFAVSDADAVQKRLQALTPWLYLNVGPAAWFVVAPGATTTKELCDRIGLGIENAVANGIAVRVEGYFGRAASSTWEWIVTKTGAELGTSEPIQKP